jgi:hypothetical protein
MVRKDVFVIFLSMFFSGILIPGVPDGCTCYCISCIDKWES